MNLCLFSFFLDEFLFLFFVLTSLSTPAPCTNAPWKQALTWFKAKQAETRPHCLCYRSLREESCAPFAIEEIIKREFIACGEEANQGLLFIYLISSPP